MKWKECVFCAPQSDSDFKSATLCHYTNRCFAITMSHMFNTRIYVYCMFWCTETLFSLQQTYYYCVLQLEVWLTTFLVVNYANLQFVIWQPMWTPAHTWMSKAPKEEGFLAAYEVAAVYLQVQTTGCSTVEQTVQQCIVPHLPEAFLAGWPCHRPSIMARRSSPLLLALAGWSPDSVNSPMILASSALACWSWRTMLFTNHSARVVITGSYTSFQ